MIDLRQFFQTANPARTLDPRDSHDRKLYIDFSEVRGEQVKVASGRAGGFSRWEPLKAV